MTSQIEFGVVSNSAEDEKLGELLCYCFNFPPSQWPNYRDRLNLENFRVIRQNGEIAAGLGIYQMGQWFGEKSVPMAGIAAVGVAPEYRGKNVALTLLTNTIRELYDRGVPISTLYPATQRLYRKVGYEQAGSRCVWEVPTASINKRDRTLPIHPVKTLQPEIFQDIYCQQAKQNNGNLDRNSGIWQAFLASKNDVVYAYFVGEQTQPQGYIIFSQKIEGNTSYLQVWDWVALTPSAIECLWTFIADYRSQIDDVRWYAGAIDPRLLLLPEQTAKLNRSELWFLRVIDLQKALTWRGYPQLIEAELHLAVKDDLIAENDGNFILTVTKGKGEVTRGGRGELQLDISSLAPLYTGLFTPLQLKVTGKLEATNEAIITATQMFVGSHPWMPDFF